MQFSLNVLWATLSSRKSGSRRPKECVVRVPMTESVGCPIVSIGTNGDLWNLADKEILWLFTAHTCSCCGMRERELLCRLNDSEEASESFFNLYPRLKAVESGAGDVRQIGRIEMMLKNGEAVSVGFDCYGESEMLEFKALASSIANLGSLEQYRLVGCNTRGHRRSIAPNSTQIEVDGVAVEEADRHMEELLEAIATEKNASSKSSERKREKKKKNCLKRHSNHGNVKEANEVDGEAFREAADSLEVLAEEMSRDAGIHNSSLPCGESANFDAEEKPSEAQGTLSDGVRDNAHSVEEASVDVPVTNMGSSEGKKKKRRSAVKEKVCITNAAGINLQPLVEHDENTTYSGRLQENENADACSNKSLGEAVLDVLKCRDSQVPFSSPYMSSEDADFASFEGWSVVVGGRARIKSLSQRSSCETDDSFEEPQSSHENARASLSLLSHSEHPCDKGLASCHVAETFQSATRSSLVTRGEATEGMFSLAFDVNEDWDSIVREEDQRLKSRIQDCAQSFEIERALTKQAVVNVDKETQTDLAFFDSHSRNLHEASIGDYKVDESTSPFFPMKISSVVPRPSCVLGWTCDPAKVLIPNLSVFPHQIFFDACLENTMEHLCLKNPMEQLCLENPLKHLCPDDPMEQIFLENAMEQLCLENPMNHLSPENPMEQYGSDVCRPRHDSDGVSESSTMCCLDEQCLREPWDEQNLRDSWDENFLRDAWTKCSCCP